MRLAASAIPHRVSTTMIELTLITQSAFSSLKTHAQLLAFALDCSLCKPLHFGFALGFALFSLAFVVRAGREL